MLGQSGNYYAIYNIRTKEQLNINAVPNYLGRQYNVLYKQLFQKKIKRDR
jgi:hypothetical protein